MLKRIVAIASVLLLLLGCSSKINVVNVNATVADLTGYGINDNTTLKQIDLNTLNELLDEKGSAVIFFSKPSCPWCQICMPQFYQAFLTLNHKLPIYYYDVTLASQEDADALIALANRLDDVLTKDEENKVEFFVPDCMAIINGKAKAHHVATVENHKDANQPLNKEQSELLQSYYIDLFNLLVEK